MTTLTTALGWVAAAIATAGWLVAHRQNKNGRSHVHFDEFGDDAELMALVNATKASPEERARARARRNHPARWR